MPLVAVVGVAGVGLEHGDFDRGRSGVAAGGHPVKGPTKLSPVLVGGALLRSVDFDTSARIDEVAFVNDDVEPAVEGLRASVEVDGDGIHHAAHVGGREVVGRCHASTVVVGVAGATGSCLVVDA